MWHLFHWLYRVFITERGELLAAVSSVLLSSGTFLERLGSQDCQL